MGLTLDNLLTEARNPQTMELDSMTPLEIVTAMNREDARVPESIRHQLPNIAQCVAWATEAIRSGGRLIYMGAGTSGRLGVLDAVECPPTFGVSPDVVVGLIAGGERAFVKAVEGAEDSRELGKADLEAIGLTPKDLVVGIAASGRTPYVLGGLAIEVAPGPECLTGSTRLKAGTAQKLILNMISTATMVGCGKAYSNLMVDVMQTNEKLVVRAQNIVMEATGVSRDSAKEAIALAGGSCKLAVTMILADCTVEEAKERLERCGGSVRQAIAL